MIYFKQSHVNKFIWDYKVKDSNGDYTTKRLTNYRSSLQYNHDKGFSYNVFYCWTRPADDLENNSFRKLIMISDPIIFSALNINFGQKLIKTHILKRSWPRSWTRSRDFLQDRVSRMKGETTKHFQYKLLFHCFYLKYNMSFHSGYVLVN